MLLTTIEFYKAVYIINLVDCLQCQPQQAISLHRDMLVVSHAPVICPDMYTCTLGPSGPRAWVYTSGNVPMIHAIHWFKIAV